MVWPFRRLGADRQDGGGHTASDAGGGSSFGFVAPLTAVDLRAASETGQVASSYPDAILQFDPSHWKRGWVDGCLGEFLQAGEELIRAQLQQEAEAKIEASRSRLSALRVELEARGERQEHLQRVGRSVEQRFQEIAQRRDARRQTFSLPLALLMLLAAAVLFLSDIPLTLQLVAEGFDLPIEVDLPIELQRPNGQDNIGVSDIFNEPLLVLSLLWESLALALGLAGAGMFYKIFLDRWVMAGGTGSRRLPVVLGCVAGLLVATTVAVGYFRSIRLENAAQAVATPAATITFVALTLLLPLVGGMCFYDGWERVTNWWHFFGARSERWLAEWKLESGLRRVGQLAREAAVLGTVITSQLEQSARAVEAALGLYRHGYLRGATTPDLVHASSSWYERCSRILARRIGGEERSRVRRLVSQEVARGADETTA